MTSTGWDNNKKIDDKIKSLLETVGLEKKAENYPYELSGGEQQRLVIARAIVNNPNLIIADEPTGNLDADTGLVVIDLLFSLNQEEGKTLILVTHETGLAERCERSISLSGGKVVNI